MPLRERPNRKLMNLNDGGAGKTTPVKKVAKPKSRSFRSATMRASGIGATPEVLHEMSNNGEH